MSFDFGVSESLNSYAGVTSKTIRRSYRQFYSLYAGVTGKNHTPELQASEQNHTPELQASEQNYTPELQAKMTVSGGGSRLKEL